MFNRQILLVLALLAPFVVEANEALARSKNCFACHTMDRKVVGPAFNDVMKKYRGDPAAAEYLAQKITRGGAGVWGRIPMPANILSSSETRELVVWLLGAEWSGSSQPVQPVLTDDPKASGRSARVM